MPTTSPNPLRVAQARRAGAVMMAKSAARAVDDPAKLARAQRIVRAAIARGVISPADVLADGEALARQAVAQGHGDTVTDPAVLAAVAATVRNGGGDDAQ